jgi:hypothetical protein
VDANVAEAPQPLAKASGPAQVSKKGQENGKLARRNNRNGVGRIMPGDDSASEDEREDEEGKPCLQHSLESACLNTWRMRLLEIGNFFLGTLLHTIVISYEGVTTFFTIVSKGNTEVLLGGLYL